MYFRILEKYRIFFEYFSIRVKFLYSNIILNSISKMLYKIKNKISFSLQNLSIIRFSGG